MLSKLQRALAELGLKRSRRQEIAAGIMAMATLTANTPRVYSEDTPTDWYDYPVKANTRLFQGEAISKDAATGYAKSLGTGEDFLGFCEHEANNLTSPGSGAAFSGATIGDGTGGNITVNVRKRGSVILSVAAGGVLAGSQADIDLTVYATDGNTFTGSSGGSAVAIGKIKDWLGGTDYLVEFESAVSRSI